MSPFDFGSVAFNFSNISISSISAEVYKFLIYKSLNHQSKLQQNTN